MSNFVANHKAMFSVAGHAMDQSRHSQSMMFLVVIFALLALGGIAIHYIMKERRNQDVVRDHKRARHLSNTQLDNTRTLLSALRMGVDIGPAPVPSADVSKSKSKGGEVAVGAVSAVAATAVAESVTAAPASAADDEDPFALWQAVQSQSDVSPSEDDEIRRAVLEAD